MLTVQEIQAISFEKAVFGGYDMKSVDEFLEHITEDFAALQKENAALKSKMKVLVDKIEEYRSVEDGMRRALVSAQTIARETLDKSKAEAEQLLFSARNEAETRIENYRLQLASASKKLEEAKSINAEFVAQLTAVYEEQLRSLAQLTQTGVLDTAPTFPTEPIAAVPTPAPAVTPKREPSLEDTQPFAKEKDSKGDSRFHITEVSLTSSDKSDDAEQPHFDFSNLAMGIHDKPEQ